MIPLHKLIPAVIFAPAILRAIGRKILQMGFFTADHIIRFKGGESPKSIFDSISDEAKVQRYERMHRLANFIDLRAMKYAELHEFEAAKYMQNLADQMRRYIEEEY